MKRVVCLVLLLPSMTLIFAIRCHAEIADTFAADLERVENSVEDSVREDMDAVGGGSIEAIMTSGVRTEEVFSYLIRLMTQESKAPLSALTLLIPVLILASLAESYSKSLRYSDTAEIMGVAVSLFTASVVISPVTELISSSADVLKGAAALMSVYLPVMAGMLLFSGHAISSGGYCAAVMTASQLIGSIASGVLAPLMSAFLALSVCSGINTSVRLNGIVELILKGFKYLITFAMSVFIAVLGLNTALSGAADSAADRAAKFGLSSFIPLIGSSVAEAYGALRTGMNVLRSGVGVFVILAVFVAFAPLLLRILLWSAAIFLAGSVCEALSVSSARQVLNTLSQFLSALRITLIAVMTVFIISSSFMMRLGGQS